MYIKTILGVYNKFNAVVSTSFKQDSSFVAALNRGCGTFINNNDITSDPKGAHKSPEMLARYCDLLLKKTGKNYGDQELDDLLNQAVHKDIHILYFYQGTKRCIYMLILLHGFRLSSLSLLRIKMSSRNTIAVCSPTV